MIKSKLDWNGGRVEDAVVGATWDNLRRAAQYYWDRVQDALNVPNSGEDKALPFGGSRRVYLNPSKPGEPPHKVTGFGAGNVQIEHDQQGGRIRIGVTANAKYMIGHELGFLKTVTITAKAGKSLLFWSRQENKWIFRKRVTQKPKAARPFLLPILFKFMEQIRLLAGEPMDKAA